MKGTRNVGNRAAAILLAIAVVLPQLSAAPMAEASAVPGDASVLATGNGMADSTDSLTAYAQDSAAGARIGMGNVPENGTTSISQNMDGRGAADNAEGQSESGMADAKNADAATGGMTDAMNDGTASSVITDTDDSESEHGTNTGKAGTWQDTKDSAVAHIAPPIRIDSQESAAKASDAEAADAAAKNGQVPARVQRTPSEDDAADADGDAQKSGSGHTGSTSSQNQDTASTEDADDTGEMTEGANPVKSVSRSGMLLAGSGDKAGGSFTINSVSNIYDASIYPSSPVISPITGFQNPEYTLKNSKLKTNENGSKFGISATDMNKLLDQNNGSVTFKNVGTVTFRRVAKANDGRYVDLTYTIDSIFVTTSDGGSVRHFDGNVQEIYFVAGSTQLQFWAGRCEDGSGNQLTDRTAFPRTKISAHVSATYSGTTENVTSARIAYTVSELDVVCTNAEYSEAIQFGSTGWGPNVYVQSDTLLAVSQNNSKFTGTQAVDTTAGRKRTAVTAILLGSQPADFTWWASGNAGTGITPRAYGKPITDATISKGIVVGSKTLTETDAKMGDTVTFELPIDMAYTTSATQMKYIVAVDTFDKIFDISTATVNVYHNGSKVTSKWNIVKNGNEIRVRSAEPTDADPTPLSSSIATGGNYTIRISAKVKKVSEANLRQYTVVTRNGMECAKIPNSASMRATPQSGSGHIETTNEVYVYVPIPKPASSVEFTKYIVKDPSDADFLRHVFRPANLGSSKISDTGADVYFLVNIAMPSTTEANAIRYVAFSDTFEDVFQVDSSKIAVYHNNTAVTGQWSVSFDSSANKLTVKSGNSDTAQSVSITDGGSWQVVIPCKVKNVDSLAQYETYRTGGTTYAKVPNSIHHKTVDQYGDSKVDDTAPVHVYLPGTSIGIRKYADKEKIQGAAPGNEIKYRFVVRNTGKLMLTNVTLSDSLQVTGAALDWSTSTDASTAAGTLAPGEYVYSAPSQAFTATYAVSAADITAGKVVNTATVTAKDLQGGTVSANDSVTTTLSYSSGISLTKSASAAEIQDATTSSTITYTFVGKNNGNVTLTGVAITDPLITGAMSYNWSQASGEGVLAPGETVTATATYTVKQADINNGYVDNTATIRGRDTMGSTQEDTASAHVALGQNPKIKVTKAANPVSIPNATTSDTIAYTVTATNTGNVTLTEVAFADLVEGVTPLTLNVQWPGADATLEPGKSATGTVTYTVKQADINRGKVRNDVTATGKFKSRTVSDSASATTSLGQVPKIAVTKAADKTLIPNAKVGDEIKYTIVGTNTGNMTLTTVSLVDTLEGETQPVSLTWNGPTDMLVPGQKVTGTFTYQVTQKDIDRGSVHNAVRITGTTEDGRTVTADSSADTELEQVPAIKVTKTVDKPSIPNAKSGDIVTFTIIGENTGNVTLGSVALEDKLEGSVKTLNPTWPAGTNELAPGKTVTATLSCTLEQADIDRGHLNNVVTITGLSPKNVKVSDQDSAKSSFGQTPLIRVTKVADKTRIDPAKKGDVITYTITATNIGSITLTDVAFTDAIEQSGESISIRPAWTGTNSLQPQESVTATVTYTVKQADIDRGLVTNKVTVTGKGNNETVTDSATASTTLAQAPAIKITKTADPTNIPTAKTTDTISYRVVGTNTGNVTLNQVALTDKLEGKTFDLSLQWDHTSGTLEPGESVTGTATYTVTQADIDRGSVKNRVDITGLAPGGATVTANAEVSTTLGRDPAIKVTKAVDKTEITNGKTGDPVKYTIVATNTGNVTLESVQFVDKLEGKDFTLPSPQWPGTAEILAPGKSVTITANYALEQADVNRGSLHNEVTVTGTAVNMGGRKVSDRATADTQIRNASSIKVTKAVDKPVMNNAKAGDILTYTVVGTNGSNVTLEQVAFTDIVEGKTGVTLHPQWAGANGILAPGASVTATGTYTVTQEDIDRGSVHNVVTITGVYSGTTLSATAYADTTILPNPQIQLTKSANRTEIQNAKVNDEITYTIVATNTGNVTLTNAAITDLVERTTGLTLDTPTAASMAPGTSFTAHGTYSVSQADVDRGSVHNDAHVTAKAPGGTEVTADAYADTVLRTTPSVSITKQADKQNIPNAKANDTISYRVVGKNTSTVTLTGVKLTDTVEGEGLTLQLTWPSTAGVLAPGAEVVGTATYSVKPADIERGSVRNTVTIEGTASGQTVRASAFADTTLEQVPAIAITKTADPVQIDNAKVDDPVKYTIVATNTGNVPLGSVTLTDLLEGEDKTGALVLQWPGTEKTLNPGESVRGTFIYTIVQKDIDRDHVQNKVSVTGKSKNGTTVSAEADATTVLGQNPSIKVTKTADRQHIPNAKVDDAITYTVTVTNTGNLTLTSVELIDKLEGESFSLSPQWHGPTGVLTPGASVTATATYGVEQKDINRGSVTNAVTASGQARGNKVSDSASVRTTLEQKPAIKVTKAADNTEIKGAVAGDPITYTIIGTNTGNTTLDKVALEDKLEGEGLDLTIQWPKTKAELEPGKSVTATVTYNVKKADIMRGSVTNKVTITGRAPDESILKDTASVSTVLSGNPSIKAAKSANVVSIDNAHKGDIITYTVSATNNGDIPLVNVTFVDKAEGTELSVRPTWPGPEGELRLGETAQAVVSYTVKQADIDRGSVHNVVTVSGQTKDERKVRDEASADTVLKQNPAIKVTKTANPTDIQNPKADSSSIRYKVVGTNTGNVTLSTVTVKDKLEGQEYELSLVWDGAADTVLEPGQSVTGTATYTVKQADIDNGSVTNEVEIEGTAPGEKKVKDNASVTTTLGRHAAIKVEKTVDQTTVPNATVGHTIAYTVIGRNIGNVTLTEVSFEDLLEGKPLSLSVKWHGPYGILVPGAEVEAVATYDISQENIDKGRVHNEVTIRGVGGGSRVEDSDDADTALKQSPAIAIEKTASRTKIQNAAEGDEIRYEIVGTNTGNVTLSAVGISDMLEGEPKEITNLRWSKTEGTLAPGETVRGTLTYSVLQKDIDRGHVVNTATIAGMTKDGTPVTATDNAETELGQNPSISLVKTADPTAIEKALPKQPITYKVVGTNTGNVTLKTVTLLDQLEGSGLELDLEWEKGQEGELAPGESVIGTATYGIEQRDIERGSVHNEAVITGKAPGGKEVKAEATADTVLGRKPAIRVEKTADKQVIPEATTKSQIKYTVSGTNTGNIALKGVIVLDTLEGRILDLDLVWPGPEGFLDVGETVTGTVTYTVSQNDIERGIVRNTVKITGSGTDGTTVSGSAYVDTELGQNPAIAIEKTASKSSIDNATTDDIINYSVVGTNTGNVILHNVAIEDLLEGAVLGVRTEWPHESGVLAPGESVRATASHTLEQADIDRGSVHNVARIIGTGANKTVRAEDCVDTDLGRHPAIHVEKSADCALVPNAKVDDTITYTIIGTNTGNVTLTGVTLKDLVEQRLEPAVTIKWPMGSGVLLPGESLKATAIYHISQADIDRGSVHNDATLTGNDPDGVPVTDTDDADVELERRPAVSIVKTADPDIIQKAVVDDEIEYTVIGTNTGNVTLTEVEVADLLENEEYALSFTWDKTEGELLPGDKVTGRAKYLVSQEDIDRGNVHNAVTITGKAPDKSPVTNHADVDTVLAQEPGIKVTKTADQTKIKNAKVGDPITYTVVGENIGGLTLVDIEFADKVQPAPPLALDVQWKGPAGVLLPGHKVTATATYYITQEDIDRGSVHNDVIVTGQTTKGKSVADKASADTDLEQLPGIKVVKTSDKPVVKAAETEAVINYTVTCTNTGNVTLTSVKLADLLEGDVLILDEVWPEGTGVLAPGKTVTATASYKVTLEDTDRGSVTNAVTATGTAPNGDTVTDKSETKTEIEQNPAIALRKDVDKTSIVLAREGNTVTYTVVGTNTGNVTLKDIVLTDLLENKPFTIKAVWPKHPGTLEPGVSVTATAVYTILQPDVDRGSLHNEATIVGVAPDETTVTAKDDADTELGRAPKIEVTKSADKPEIENAKPGDLVTYTITGTNIGNTTLTDVTLFDEVVDRKASYMLGTGKHLAVKENWNGASMGMSTLLPGESVHGTCTYELTQEDIDAGGIVNHVLITGNAPDGDTVDDMDDAKTKTPGCIAIHTEKAADRDEIKGAKPGDKVLYTIIGRNTSNVTLRNVKLTDKVMRDDGTEAAILVLDVDWRGASAGAGTLLPGEAVRATGEYELTQADIDTGGVVNHVEITGEPPEGDPATDDDEAGTKTPESPSIKVEKSADRETIDDAKPGDIVNYEIVVTNTGNVTLHGVDVRDALAKRGSTYPGSEATTLDVSVRWEDTSLGTGFLAPGESVKATGTYTLTQEDIDAGGIVNHVHATGNSPKGTPVEDDDEASTRTPASPGIDVVKTPSTDKIEDAKPGMKVLYEIVATNTGNVTLKNVRVSDEITKKGAAYPGGMSKPLELTMDWTGASSGEGVLRPGESVRATCEYELTQADIDAGGVVNHATATGTPPEGEPVEDTDEPPTDTPASPGIEVVKTPDRKEIEDAKPGDIVSYEIVGTNTGNVTLTGVSVTDKVTAKGEALMNGRALGLAYDWDGASMGQGVLLPGESVKATCAYTLTQTDIDAGGIVNHAFIIGYTPDGDPVEDTDEPPTELPANPGISVEKTADADVIESAKPGDIIRYTIVGTNTGNVTLTNVELADALARRGADLPHTALGLEYDWSGATKGAGVLLPGESVKAACKYELTQEDIDAGGVVNTATATGNPPEGEPVTDDDDAKTKTPGDISIVVNKTADQGEIVNAMAGDIVRYEIVGKNTSNVTLRNVSVTDMITRLGVDMASEDAVAVTLDLDWSGASKGAGILLPGETVKASYEYALTQEDIDAGSVTNHVAITGEPPEGDPAEDDDDVTTKTPANPGIDAVKTSDKAKIENAKPGDIIRYAITATNTGNVTLTGVVLTDKITEAGIELPTESSTTLELSVDWSGASKGEGILLPGETVTATCEYALTQEDIDAGGVTNHVLATGNPPEGDPVGDPDKTTTEIPGTPAIDIVKVPSADSIKNAKPGDVITYAITATNTGNVTLTGVSITDEVTKKGITLPSKDAVTLELKLNWEGASKGPGTLLPGEAVTATCAYALTQEDIDAGGIVNHATATGNPPEGDPVEDTDEPETDTPASPGIEVVKTPDKTVIKDAKAGDIVKYTIVGTNTGNVTLTDVSITDELVQKAAEYPSKAAVKLGVVYNWKAASKGTGILLPGETVTATCSYALTQEDIDAGGIVNHALIVGNTPNGDPVEDTDDPPTDTPASPAISIRKEANRVEISNAEPGVEIEYTFTVTNEGNVTLRGVSVEDHLDGVTKLDYDWRSASAKGVLAPGETVTATASYFITGTDIENGSVTNTATASGNTPDGKKVFADDDAATKLQTPPPVPTATPTPVPGRPPQTGDESNAWLFMLLAAASALAILGVLAARKARKA